MNEIILRKEEFKALSSDTRIELIRLLKERNYTLSEMSAKLKMSSPTIKQHLDTLAHSDLIEQKDEGRKWKYYSLTRKGKKLIEPETPKIMILWAATLLGVLSIFFLAFSITENPFSEEIKIQNTFSASETLKTTGANQVSDSYAEKKETQETQKTDIEIIIALIAVSLITGFLFSKASAISDKKLI